MRASTGTSGRSISSYSLVQSRLLDFAAQRAVSRPVMSADSASSSAELQVEAPQRNVGQAVRGVRRIEQVRIQHGIVAHAVQRNPQRTRARESRPCNRELTFGTSASVSTARSLVANVPGVELHDRCRSRCCRNRDAASRGLRRSASDPAIIAPPISDSWASCGSSSFSSSSGSAAGSSCSTATASAPPSRDGARRTLSTSAADLASP